MILSHAEQIDLRSIMGIDFDLFLASSGFEKRAPFFFSKFNVKNSSNQKYIVTYNDREVLKNETILRDFKKLGFKPISSLEDKSTEVKELLLHLFESRKLASEINILVDYSCMTKVWYSSVLSTISKQSYAVTKTINVYFTYTEAKFERPQATNPNYSASFLPEYYNMDTPNKKVALIIGLGYEENRALGLIEYLHLDYNNCYVFKTDKVSNPEFYDVVKANNYDLLNLIPVDHIFDYPIQDLRYTDSLLTTLTTHLAQDRRVIIAPIGPKPFSLLSLLIATKHKEISVYRVTQTPSETPADRIANDQKNPIICKAVFVQNPIKEKYY